MRSRAAIKANHGANKEQAEKLAKKHIRTKPKSRLSKDQDRGPLALSQDLQDREGEAKSQPDCTFPFHSTPGMAESCAITAAQSASGTRSSCETLSL